MNADAMALAAILDSKDEAYRIRKQAEAEQEVIRKRYTDFTRKEEGLLANMAQYLQQQYDSTQRNEMLSDINRRYAMDTKQWEHCFDDFKEAGHFIPDKPWRIILRVMHQDNVTLFVDHMIEKFNEGN